MCGDCSDRQAVIDVLVRYATCLDTRDLQGLNAVLARDVVADYGGGYVLKGRDAIIHGIASTLDHCGPTQHLVGNFVVRILRDTAETECAARIIHVGAGDRAGLEPYEVIGDYRDVLARSKDGWRIVRRTFQARIRRGDPAVIGNAI